MRPQIKERSMRFYIDNIIDNIWNEAVALVIVLTIIAICVVYSLSTWVDIVTNL